jgi:hypothetical protein
MNLVSTQESPVLLTKFQMALRFKILTSSGFKKGTQIYYMFFFSKIPAKEHPPSSPTGRLRREIPFYRAFCISLENLLKIPLNKKALRKKRPFMFPEAWSLWKQTPISEPCLTYLSESLVKEPSLKKSLAKRCPVPTALIHSPFEVPGI